MNEDLDYIKKFAKIDEDIISMISEIEYSVDKYKDSIIDDKRFLMTMLSMVPRKTQEISLSSTTMRSLLTSKRNFIQ